MRDLPEASRWEQAVRFHLDAPAKTGGQFRGGRTADERAGGSRGRRSGRRIRGQSRSSQPGGDGNGSCLAASKATGTRYITQRLRALSRTRSRDPQRDSDQQQHPIPAGYRQFPWCHARFTGLFWPGNRSCVLLGHVGSGAVPEWWNYPHACGHGHPWGPGRVIVSWMPCSCAPARAARSPGSGHLTVSCQHPGCTSRWYKPRHERPVS